MILQKDTQKKNSNRASEQTSIGMAVGLAIVVKGFFLHNNPFFFFYRAFETIRNYIDHENIPVFLVGSGLYKDYEHDGYSHDASDINRVMSLFKNIVQIYPNDKENIEGYLNQIITENKPTF